MTRVSLSKVFMCQKKVWAMLKKEKRKYPCQKSMREKQKKKNVCQGYETNNPMLKSMKKKEEEEKKDRKIAHTFK